MALYHWYGYTRPLIRDYPWKDRNPDGFALLECEAVIFARILGSVYLGSAYLPRSSAVFHLALVQWSGEVIDALPYSGGAVRKWRAPSSRSPRESAVLLNSFHISLASPAASGGCRQSQMVALNSPGEPPEGTVS